MENYVGNERNKETLKRYLKGKKPQSILLTGNTGCGKTTIARLLIKEYLCYERNEETGACGKCEMCVAVDDYILTGSTEMLPDIYEIDITDKSGKSDIDSILETVEYPSISGGWKVYLLDEVHMASRQAQSRILKILEEPPENVLFIFCTTDPDKMLDTLKNRCQLKLKVVKPGMSDIVKLLRRVCLEEDKDYDIDGLRTIASRSDFVIRDSLNNLERVLETRGDAKSDSVNEEFNEISNSILFNFYEAYKKKDFLSYMSLLYRIKVEYDFGQFLTSLTNFTMRGIYIMNGVDIEGVSENEIKSYVGLFKSFSTEDLSYILSSLRRMDIGDVEANLIGFIYCQDEYKHEGERGTNLNMNAITEIGPEEGNFRNQVMAQREKSKVAAGVKSLDNVMREVSISDMSSLFQFEKVSDN
jgi:DNA polymerase-3 subunit gamma/tau